MGPMNTGEDWGRRLTRFVLATFFGSYIVAAISAGLGILIGVAGALIADVSWPWRLLILVGIFLLVSGVAAAILRWLLPSEFLSPQGTATARTLSSTTPQEDGRRADLQKIRLIRNEIDDGMRIVQRAIGVSQVHDLVSDHNWIAHRNELAAIAEAGDAHRLAGIAWDGFRRYNAAVKARAFISDADLEEIARTAQRAVDALGVAADALR